MKNGGLTLVELVVVIAIMGIIVLISIPLIRNISTNSQNSKYETYKKSAIYGAKLYLDSYYSDLDIDKDGSCGIILYSELSDRGLLKDIKIDGVTCVNNRLDGVESESYVIVYNNAGNYIYDTQLVCREITNNDNLGSLVYPLSDKLISAKDACNDY